jgi:WD40 repeat protein
MCLAKSGSTIFTVSSLGNLKQIDVKKKIVSKDYGVVGGGVTCLTVVKNCRGLLVGTANGIIKEFDTQRFQEVRVWGENVLGSSYGVYSLCVMGNGNSLLVGFKGGKVRAYNLRRRKLIKTLEVKHRGGQVVALKTFDLE